MRWPASRPRRTGDHRQIETCTHSPWRGAADQKRIDERMRHAVDDLTSLPALARDLAALEKRIGEMEKRLSDLDHQASRTLAHE
jgi:polyhydroxyalkanoate synthesis regulator phasin